MRAPRKHRQTQMQLTPGQIIACLIGWLVLLGIIWLLYVIGLSVQSLWRFLGWTLWVPQG